jgi:3-oxoacyl-[acyl-carrier protein] reductase
MEKTVLITGASRGIGRATAMLFAQKRYNIVVNYLNSKSCAEKLLEEIAAMGGRAVAVRADVCDENQVLEMFETAKSAFGNVDVLVNNAGIAQEKLFLETTSFEFRKMFDVNVFGAFCCCKAALKDMVKNHCGKIINISSIWGICGASCEVAYSASKAAIVGMTKALAKELGPCGINVNCVAPGVIDTDMNADLDEDTLEALKNKTPLMRLGNARDVANVVLFLASDEADFVTGQVVSPNGGFVI